MADRVLMLCKKAVEPGDRIVAAVSGGADSLCLAHALHQVLPKGAHLLIAHVNHQLRGEDADADARFVCQWAAEAGLPRALVRVQVKNLGGESLQNVARAERYKALLKICHSFKANKLATAHHAGDQVETFLLNLLRGSGSKGLQGIPRERSLDDKTQVIRPLLDVSRTEIEEYCARNGLQWRTDQSNDSLYYLRNRIRHQLLPQLRTYNPAVDRVLLNTINNLRMDQELLESITSQALKEVELISPLPFAPRALSAEGLVKLSPALQKRVIIEMMPEDSESVHINAVLRLLSGETGAAVDLPRGNKAYRLHDSIAFGHSPSEKAYADMRVPIPGRVQSDTMIIRTETKLFPGSLCFWLPEQENHIVVGSRKPGDYFYPAGGGKKLKSYMIDRKIPRWLRDSYPVLRVGGEIFWVAGLVRDQRFAQSKPGTRSIYIKIDTTGGERF